MMHVSKRIAGALLMGALALVLVASVGTAEAQSTLTPEEALGKVIFFDTALSTPPGQACAACHASEVGFTGPDMTVNIGGAVYPGAVHTRFGNRKPPASAYGGDSPILSYDEEAGWVGGMFWDGRATGWTLGDPLAEQAQGPFLNPLEQNMPGAKQVCLAIRKSGYKAQFEEVWGSGSLDCVKDVAGTYERIARSIAAYERSAESSAFTSKYDAYLKGEAQLTEQEALGLAVFNGKGQCANCHPSQPGPNGEAPVFTDFTYDNLGIPKNPANPFYTMPPKWNPDGAAWIDKGLGGFLKAAGYAEDVYQPEWGKMKVPTLRNVDKRPSEDFVKAYGHNGYFKSLEAIVHFYNTRDVAAWPAPEVAENVNTDETGNLGLSAAEEAALVAFMRTLSDGYTATSMAAVSAVTQDEHLFLPLLHYDR